MNYENPAFLHLRALAPSRSHAFRRRSRPALMPRRTINDLSLLDPRFRQHQLHDSFTPTADLHAILMEFREYHSLPDPAPASYQHANLFVPLLEIYPSLLVRLVRIVLVI